MSRWSYLSIFAKLRSLIVTFRIWPALGISRRRPWRDLGVSYCDLILSSMMDLEVQDNRDTELATLSLWKHGGFVPVSGFSPKFRDGLGHDFQHIKARLIYRHSSAGHSYFTLFTPFRLRIFPLLLFLTHTNGFFHHDHCFLHQV